MAPNSSKRMKGVQMFRPFVYGSVAKLFDKDTNPKPEGTPEEYTHSWTVFVKGVDDTDITYWLKKVQFKLHDSIVNPIRMIENVQPGEQFQVQESGWGEFEIVIKLYFIPESNEKPQTLYHHLRLHPYGDDKLMEQQKREMTVQSMIYEEIVWTDPYESFFEIMTTPMDRSKGGKGGLGKGTRISKNGMVSSIGERTATIPNGSRPGQPFSKETEKEEIKRLQVAISKVEETIKTLQAEKAQIDEETAKTRAAK